jgi:hypothetical protein
MEWNVTLFIIGLGAVAGVFSAWKSGRPRKDSLKPQWISWKLMTLVSGAVLLLGVVHAINLMGLHTGGGGLGGPSRP